MPLSLVVLGLTAAAQAVIFVLTGSVALLADLIHNVGDALTAVPLGVAFALPVSVKLLQPSVPAVGAVVSTKTEIALLVELLPAGSVTIARNW